MCSVLLRGGIDANVRPPRGHVKPPTLATLSVDTRPAQTRIGGGVLRREGLEVQARDEGLSLALISSLILE